jgi:transcription elongation factor GreB
MSRGFVKEDDLELAGTDLPERPVSTHPNYVTPNGLLQLEHQAALLEQAYLQLLPQKDDPTVSQRLSMIERDKRYIQSRLESVILVEPAKQNMDTALFGAKVTVEDENGLHQTFTIVGEDEADIADNKVSYVSPIAKALIGKKIGDLVIWQRPAGNMQLEILEIHY